LSGAFVQKVEKGGGTLNGDSDIYFTYAYASSSRVLCTKKFHERPHGAIVEVSATTTSVVGADKQRLKVEARGIAARSCDEVVVGGRT